MLMFLLFLSFTFSFIATSPPCAHVTHDECRDDDNSFLETEADNKEFCRLMCFGSGERCKFFIFDQDAYAKGNCRLYAESFAEFIDNCNELAGPKTSTDDCDFLNPPDNSCQIYREGNCHFGHVEEKLDISSWENCNAACKSTSECQYWRFQREEGKCLILYSAERRCTWEFSPREPTLEDCGEDPPTTTTPTPTTSTTVNTMCGTPEPIEHGDWFCPSSSSANTATCHLECHPGYVSDQRTIVTCTDGLWASFPTCVAALALITGTYDHNTVEVYGEGVHWKLPNLPDNRWRHALDITDSSILLCGGMVTEKSCLTLTESLQWRYHSTTTSERKYHTSVSILGQLHLLGGDFSSSTEHLSPATSSDWMQGMRLKWETDSACAAKIHPEVYITTGGFYHKTSVISYNVTSGVATSLQNLLWPRYQHGCAYILDTNTGFKGILVAGGTDQNKDEEGWGLKSSLIYNLSSGEWRTMGKMTRGRRGVELAVIGRSIFAMGGHESISGLASVDKFNLTSGTWSGSENMMEPRYLHAVTGVPPSRVPPVALGST